MSIPSNTNAWAYLTHHSKRQLDRFTHFRITYAQSPIFTQTCPLPWGNRQSQLPASSSDPPDPPRQTTSRSSQPLSTMHRTSREMYVTDRQMARATKPVAISADALLIVLYSDAANNRMCRPIIHTSTFNVELQLVQCWNSECRLA